MEGVEEAWQWQTKEIFWSVIAIALSFLVFTIWEKLWLKPQRIRSVLHKQGNKGLTPSFPQGNLSEIQRIQSHFSNLSSSSSAVSSISDQWFSFLFPYLQQWRKQYGATYLYSVWSRQHLYVEDPELIKELNLTRNLDLGKSPTMSKVVKPLLGDGILMANGDHWSLQRNMIAPQFFLSKIQNMVDLMEESTKEIMRKWERCIGESGGEMAEIVIENDLKSLTTDVICKACFGSSSYVEGIQIFDKLVTLQSALTKPSLPLGFSFLRYLPTKGNREIWSLEKEIEKPILKVVKDREHVNQIQKDLLQITTDSTTVENQSGWGILKKLRDISEAKKLIVDMCKNIYFAGSESTAVLVMWALISLASHPHWQERLRSEILETYPKMSPHCFRDMDKFRKLKQLTMVIQECLRLYSPGIIVSMEALEELKLGDLVVPKGTLIQFFIQALHRDPNVWGEDATEFRPERFSRGVSEACKNPNAYIPFGVGSRICLGQHFAMTEAKIMLSLLLSNFSFSLSPNYRHFPSYNMLLRPKYGAPILVTKL